MSSRNGGFTQDEDILLCTKWLNISQDPKVGRYQTMKEFWSRVANAYNEAAEEQQIEQRTVRSLQTRMDRITAEVKKMLGCIRQIENMNPSGASNNDILIRANMLFKQEVKNSKGFRFEHVRSIVADFVKCQDNVPTARQIARQQISLNMSNSSHSENPNPESPAAVSPGISSFSINLDDENVEATSSQRPIGIKKAKLKRKMDDQLEADAQRINNQNQQLLDALQKSSEERRMLIDIEQKKIEEFKRYNDMRQEKEDRKILSIKLENVQPQDRETVMRKQERARERENMRHQQSSNFPTNLSQYFDNIGGSGSGLPEY